MERLRVLAVGLLFILMLSASPVYAGDIIVDTNSTADNNSDGFCSLREAIIAANEVTPADGSYNECTGGDPTGADTITLSSAGPYSLSAVLPTITSPITINGGSNTISASTTGFRAITIESGGALTLNNVTISGFNTNTVGAGVSVTGGTLTLNSNAVITGNQTSNLGGGGVYAFNNATVMINGGTISQNTATTGSGGGIYASSSVTITLQNGGQITGNRAQNGGGVFFIASSTMTVSGAGTEVSDNAVLTLGGDGAGIWQNGGSLTISNGVLFDNNTGAQYGGAIYSNGTLLSVSDATFTNNKADGTSGSGGAIRSSSNTTTIVDSLFEDNYATQNGGAVQINGNGSITNSTVRSNDSGNAGGGLSINFGNPFTISNVLIELNTALQGGGMYISGTGSPFLIEANTRILNNTASIAGGGIRLNTGNATLDDVVISGNTVTSTAGNGGGISKNEGTLVIQNGTEITNNNGGRDGGGLYLAGGQGVTITNSLIMGNTAENGQGGGIYVSSGTALTVTGSRIQSNRNTGGTGGAIYSTGTGVGGAKSVTESCIVNNSDSGIVQNSGVFNATGNWWGTNWGPQILGASANSGSLVSVGDSVTGDGSTTIDVDGTPPLNTGAENGVPPPTGDWQMVAPSVAGATCLSCSGVSTIAHGTRTCS